MSRPDQENARDPLSGTEISDQLLREEHHFRIGIVPWLAAGFGLLLVLAAWQISRTATRDRMQAEFDSRSMQIEAAVLDRLRTYVEMLRGGVGLFAGSEHVTRDEWKAYVHALHVNQYYPGIQGIGFAEYFPGSRLDEHTEAVRADGFPGYSVYPEGYRPAYAAIVFLEPFDRRNQRAFGYDMFSERVRRKAMEQARDTGRFSMSGKVILVQEDGLAVQSGFLVYLPVYRGHSVPDTVKVRREQLKGYVYSPFRMNDFMRGILVRDDEYIHMQIYDGDLPTEDSLLYRNSSVPERRSAFIRQSVFEFGDHQWLFEFSSSRAFEKSMDLKRTNMILALGVLICLLLFHLLTSLFRSRRQASALAVLADDLHRMNRQLQEEMESRQKAEQALVGRARELDDFNLAMIGRESRVIELKEEVNRLCRELGREPLYSPVWREVPSDSEGEDLSEGAP
jgi:CHASE1-domain containing sensor protein